MTSRISDPRALLSAAAVRAQARQVLQLAREDRLPDWRVNLDAMPKVADFVAGVVRERYPRLDPPPHARWRHFVFDGRDLWAERAAAYPWSSAAARARAEFDLAIVSVLLDAGADPAWRYTDAATGIRIGRSEGLALASLRLFEAGAFSADPRDPLRADATALMHLTEPALALAFQRSTSNPFPRLESRAALLNRLGKAFAASPAARPGDLFDRLTRDRPAGPVPAPDILAALLDALGSIWLGRPVEGGVPLGDCWWYPPLAAYVPLHKLSQWLAYSLVEPLRGAGVTVTDLDGLTGLAEYRNGGLFLDAGVLGPREPAMLDAMHAVSDPFVIGWRSLTVALLDELAPLLRAQLGVSAERFPLACVLEGGTWAAGRRIAAQKRADGGPPLRIDSDGTVF